MEVDHLAIGVAAFGQAETEIHHVRTVESGIAIGQLEEDAEECARAKEEHETERDLADHKALSQAERMAMAARGERRGESTEESDEGTDGRRENQRPGVDREAFDWLAEHDRKPAQNCASEQQTERATRSAERESLGEQLANDIGEAGAQGGADFHFARAGKRAGKNQIHDVGAHDGQEQERGNGEEQKRTAQAALPGLVEGLHVSPAASVLFGPGVGEAGADGAEFGLRGGEGGGWLESADGLQRFRATRAVVAMADRNVGTDVRAGGREDEIRGQDPDYFVRLLVELDGAAHDVGRAMKLACP